jgi:heptosyltransferase-1
MRILMVKTSSMGDLVHMLSALREASDALPTMRIDWVCEEAFTDIPILLPCVDQVIPVAMRRWRRQGISAITFGEIRSFVRRLRQTNYDYVIDAQGLLKSAWITRLARCARGGRWGYDWASAREPLASLVLDHRVSAPSEWHAIERLRYLVKQALGLPQGGMICTLDPPHDVAASSESPATILLLHGTSRIEKSWPVAEWIDLGRRLASRGFRLALPWGSEAEFQQAQVIAQGIGAQAIILDRLSIGALARQCCTARGAIGLDSGLMHLSVALGRPTVALMTGAHHARFSAHRFAPLWAPHARVIASQAEGSISAEMAFNAWQEVNP